MNSNECREDGNRHAFRDHLHQKRLLRAIAHYVAPALFLAFAFSLADVAPTHAQKAPKVSEKNLPKTYREWLDRDVAYIITKEERDTFLRLTTDEARDKFIDRFWAIRNPDPGSPSNTYKDDIYARIAYADANFSTGSGGEGWRTARGQTYITLGPPQQREKHYGAGNMRPFEIWFYSNTTPPLPSFFYVLFYQRDNIGDYRFYSPYFNGPTELVTGVEAVNDNTAALRMIQASVGSEVARIAQTLLPDETIDQQGRISLQSDIMLSQLKSLADQPAYKAALERRRNLLENVSSRIVVEGRNLDIITLPVRDSHGLTRLDYAIRLHSPSDLTVTDNGNGRYTFAIEVRVRVFGPDNKLIFTQERSVSDSLDKSRLNAIKDRAFGYESILPLPPGKYRLDFLLTDWQKKIGLHAEREVTIPNSASDKLVIPGVVPFISADAVESSAVDHTPFAMAGVKFTPIAGSPLMLNPGQNLQIAYQIWVAPQELRAEAGQKLDVHYALGQPANLGTSTVVDDQVAMNQFDATGSLVNGKKFPLNPQWIGSYMFTVAVSRAGTSQHASVSLNFKAVGGDIVQKPWDVTDSMIAKEADQGILDQRRGLCYFSLGQMDEARGFFRRALARDHANDAARSRLVEAYFAQKDYSSVVSLYNDAGITAETDSETLLRIAESLEKSGDAKRAMSLLEDSIRARPEDGSLYLALADYYERTGNAQKAAELTKKGRSYLGSAAASATETRPN
ncbi:MAG TPA: GWxTD domain-containing protein [Candidatus Acidoferrum sp.]|nr:GWxTD domain-containing protein [Candidatus Acidoferrum sp.]